MEQPNKEQLEQKIRTLEKGLEVLTMSVIAHTELIRQQALTVQELNHKLDLHINNMIGHLL